MCALSGKGPGYCYMIGRGPNSCLLCHLTGILFPPLCKKFSALRFRFCWFLKPYVFDCTRYKANWEKHNWRTGTLFWWSSTRVLILSTKTCKPKKQKTWNTSHLYGIAWSSGKLDYDKLFAIFYDIKVINVGVFAKGLEKCTMLTRPLGQNVENLDDYGCPKFQDLVGEGKMNTSWICSSYLFRHKTRLHCAERKAKVYRESAMQPL